MLPLHAVMNTCICAKPYITGIQSIETQHSCKHIPGLCPTQLIMPQITHASRTPTSPFCTQMPAKSGPLYSLWTWRALLCGLTVLATGTPCMAYCVEELTQYGVGLLNTTLQDERLAEVRTDALIECIPWHQAGGMARWVFLCRLSLLAWSCAVSLCLLVETRPQASSVPGSYPPLIGGS